MIVRRVRRTEMNVVFSSEGIAKPTGFPQATRLAPGEFQSRQNPCRCRWYETVCRLNLWGSLSPLDDNIGYHYYYNSIDRNSPSFL